jgi:hypothetical protein
LIFGGTRRRPVVTEEARFSDRFPVEPELIYSGYFKYKEEELAAGQKENKNNNYIKKIIIIKKKKKFWTVWAKPFRIADGLTQTVCNPY